MPDYLYLDIETIPATEAEIIAEIAANVTPPANMKKAETIAKWEAEDKPQAVQDAVAKTSFSGAYGKVCCIGWAWNEGNTFSKTIGDGIDEAGVISSVVSTLIAERPSNERPVIVGHYVAGFDIRFLWQRAFVLGVSMPAWFPRDPKPWGGEVHDTMTMWAGAKDSISLDKLCKVLGVTGKYGIDGSMVAGMWARGERDAIAEYCRDDVERVRAVHRKMLVSYGEVA